MKYDNDEHARRLLMMLETDSPCDDDNCPAEIDVVVYCSMEVKNICKGFIDLAPRLTNEYRYTFCPCHALGSEEAIKRTWLALEAKGYLD